MGQGESQSHSWHIEFHSRLHNLNWNVFFFFFFCDMTITCALRWGVASVGVYCIGHCSPHRGTTFQVQDRYWRTTLNRGLNCEESRIVALVVVLTCIYMFCIRVL